MRSARFEWQGSAGPLAVEIRAFSAEGVAEIDVTEIERRVVEGGDAAVLELTARFDATEAAPAELRVDPAEPPRALAGIDSALREALELAAANIRQVAEAQLGDREREVKLPQGQTIVLGEAPVRAAGVYAPGGGAAYPSSVLMCCLPARVAGVDRLAVASPPGPDGRLGDAVLAACAIAEVDAVYAMGGAQAIFALAHGTETIAPVDVVAGPGNAWVREAKRFVYGQVGIDSLAGPSELMVVAGHDTDPEWAALDLCAQAEHGPETALVAVAVEEAVLDGLERAVGETAAARASVSDAALALVQVPDLGLAVELANELAPEHLQLMSEDAYAMVPRVRSAGCVFVGRASAAAFGDYAAGSNHVLPTGGAGRFSGPLGPGTFRRRTARVSLPGSAAAALAPHVDALARAEGFPVHGESARARA
jgi:histidinol dehydrogenase